RAAGIRDWPCRSPCGQLSLARHPKILYQLPGQGQAQDAILSFDWAPDGQRLALIRAPRGASSGAIQIIDVSTGAVVSSGITWSPNGTKLAFRRMTATGPELWVYDLSASGASAYRRGGPLDISAAAWLSDNSTLFAATGVGVSAALYRVNIFSAGEVGGVVKVTGGKDAPNGSTPNTPAYDR